MERLLKPDRLAIDPDSHNATQEWKHWFKTFQNFILSIEGGSSDEEKLRLLTNLISSTVYEYISEAKTYNDAVSILKNVYEKPVNEIFARHKLKTRRQEPGESTEKYLEVLKRLAKECNFKAVTAETNRDDFIRDVFIDGLLSSLIRQRLLENNSLTLNEAFQQARSLELAQQQSQAYNHSSFINAAVEKPNRKSSPGSSGSRSDGEEDTKQASPQLDNAIAAVSPRCYFCGREKHSRLICPARDAECTHCGKKGHFQRVCRQKQLSYKSSQALRNPKHSTNCIACVPSCLSKAIVPVTINGIDAHALIDTGSSSSFISKGFVQKVKLSVIPCKTEQVSMASTSLTSSVTGQCKIDLILKGNEYKNVLLGVLPDLCSDIIIGHDLLRSHSSIEVQFGGVKPPLSICSLAVANVEPAKLFEYLSPDCKPIAVKSRRHTHSDSVFIESEIQRLLREGVIEESTSPWRAQVLVVASENHKRRMVVDYSQTVNQYTNLDAFPIPRIDDIVNKVANFKVYSSLDLSSAYHQIPIRGEDKPYTAFEACGQLWQFTRIPFGVTNGVPAFQRVMNGIVKKEKLQGVLVYLDDVTICGNTQEEHDRNLSEFMKAVSKYNLTLNLDKCSFSMETIHLLGYVISHKSICPDPERLGPLLELPVPSNTASLRRALGMFAHHSHFIPKFAEKIQILQRSSFPFQAEALKVFRELKSDVQNAMLTPIDASAVFTVETDASNLAIGALLSQNGKPVAFFSRSLTKTEQRHSAIEKEAYAIVEAVRKWRHFLLGRHFILITDQKSISFMYRNNKAGKIKNDKIMRWKLELSSYDFEIVYRPGKENEVADALSRISSSVCSNISKLASLHEALCHPGQTRLYHWVRSKNLPFSLDEIRQVTSSCRVCAEVKPRFHQHVGRLIKATQPFERLNIDFKGPLPSSTRNRYLLIIVDEFSRFPFAYPCPDMTTETVISRLKDLFCMFGTPSYVHSDRGSSFMSQEIKSFLFDCGVATSRTTPYNPRGNGQSERYVGIIWKTIELALKSQKLNISRWEHVLNEALHSVRSLLCTAINTTPHERLFKFCRKSSYGKTTPSWLLKPGPVLMKKLVRQSKYEPHVEEVHLLEGNPEYSYVRLPDGRETTISTRLLAPPGSLLEERDEEIQCPSTENKPEPDPAPQVTQENVPDNQTDASEVNPVSVPLEGGQQILRRSSRIRKPSSYLTDYVT